MTPYDAPMNENRGVTIAIHRKNRKKNEYGDGRVSDSSSNTTAGAAATGTGVGPGAFDYILGVVKAYTTRVGAGPFPTELFDDMGRHLAQIGAEFGATTGRPRRCGWFDAVSLKRAVFTNSLTGLCVTKLDVLDGLETVKICVGYRLDGGLLETPPLLMDRYGECEPVYETMPGWQTATSGVTSYAELPSSAPAFIQAVTLFRPPLARPGYGKH